MIPEEVTALVNHLRTQVKVGVSFGDRQLQSQEMPHVKIVPNGAIAVSARATMNSVEVSVSVRVVADRDSELEALVVFGRVIKALSLYHQSQGHVISGEGSQEYGTDTFTISVPYTIKTII